MLGLATGGFLGYMPVAPGSFGAVIGLLAYCVMPLFPWMAVLMGLILFIGFSVWVSQAAEKLLNEKDPGCIIIDEIAGMAVTLFGFPFSIWIGLAGFMVFRFFDILKPFPIGLLEKKLPGGVGVVADDLAAGIIGNLVLRGLLLLT